MSDKSGFNAAALLVFSLSLACISQCQSAAAAADYKCLQQTTSISAGSGAIDCGQGVSYCENSCSGLLITRTGDGITLVVDKQNQQMAIIYADGRVETMYPGRGMQDATDSLKVIGAAY